MRTVRQMCGAKLRDKVACVGLRGRLGLQDTVVVLQCNRLRWYGQVLQKDDSKWVKKCVDYVVEALDLEVDRRERGRQ